MRFPARRTGYYVGLVIATTLLFTALYNVGMASLEGRPQPLYRSLEVVIQSFTTTGYGEDAPWQTLEMNVLMILMQLAGIGLILTAVDIFAVPWLRSTLSPTVPEAATDMQDHVLICAHTARTDAFISELDARDQPYVLIEPDLETASELYEAGYRVVHGDPESTEMLANANIEQAITIVADVADDTNASIALSARALDPEIRIITLVTDSELSRYQYAAGVDEILSPRQLLGKSLAAQVPATITTDIEDGIPISETVELVELAVDEDSEFCHRTFGEASLREQFGVNVIGMWIDGSFETPVDRDQRVEPGSRLLVAGEPTQVDALREATASTVREIAPHTIILAGYGDSGQAAADELTISDSQLTVLDIEPADVVDVVGDARDPDVLDAAGIDDCSGLILTVADDTTAIFTTLIARELNPDLKILVRANEQENVDKLYRAGATYVLSLATVSGRMLAATVFEDEEVLAYGTQLSVVRLPAGKLAGSTLADEAVRTKTGNTVIAVLRDGETLTEFDPKTFRFAEGDEVIIAGPDSAIREFEDRYCC